MRDMAQSRAAPPHAPFTWAPPHAPFTNRALNAGGATPDLECEEEPWNAVEMEGELTDLKSKLAAMAQDHAKTAAFLVDTTAALKDATANLQDSTAEVTCLQHDLHVTKSNLAVEKEKTDELAYANEIYEERACQSYTQITSNNEQLGDLAMANEATEIELRHEREKLVRVEQQLAQKAKEAAALRLLNTKSTPSITPVKGKTLTRKTGYYRGKQIALCGACKEPSTKCQCSNVPQ